MFETALEHVARWEGGFVDHPDDPGGATNLGITQGTLDRTRNAHPDWGLPADVRDLTHDDAGRIYRADYWDAVHGDELPGPLAVMAFDCAVNQGVRRATRILQRSVDATVDGVIGPKTLAAVHRHTDQRGVVRDYASLRMREYGILDEIDDTFLLGWARRLFSTYDLCIDLMRGAPT